MRLNSLFPNLTDDDRRSKRSALLRLAIISSFSSKVFGLVLQTVAIPLVYHSLGEHRYELYLLLTAALATIALAQMGAGPGLTQGIARASAAGRHDHETSLLHAAFRLTGSAALIGGCVVLTAIHLISPAVLFGPVFAAERASIVNIANVCVFVVAAQLVAGVVDSALSGYQEQIFSNLGSMISNILSIGLLLVVCAHAPTITAVILVLYGAPTLSRVANLAFLYCRRPYLLRGTLHSCRGFYGALLNVGLAFWFIELGSLIELHGGTYVLAHLSTTKQTDLFGIVSRSLSLAGSVVIIFTQPFWPAFVDAIAHRDFEWIHRSYARIRRIVTVYSSLIALVTVTAGQGLFQHLMHVNTEDNYALFFVMGAYFVANNWTHLYYVVMMGIPGIWRVALVSLSENFLKLLIGLPLVPRFGATGMAFAYVAASVILPVWILPLMMKRSLHAISDTGKVVSANG